MRLKRNTLNNMTLDNIRKDRIYQAVITDLALTGNISRSDAEMLLGYEIPEYLKSPEGDTISSWNSNDDDAVEEEAVTTSDVEEEAVTTSDVEEEAVTTSDVEEEAVTTSDVKEE